MLPCMHPPVTDVQNYASRNRIPNKDVCQKYVRCSVRKCLVRSIDLIFLRVYKGFLVRVVCHDITTRKQVIGTGRKGF